jgi:hypothetical protein
MNTISEKEESIGREEEIKRKLKSKPMLFQIKSQKIEEAGLRIQPALKAKIGMATERYLPLRQVVQLRIATIESVKPAFKELRRVVNVESMKPVMLKATVQTNRETEMKVELKPKIPKVEARLPKLLKTSEISMSVRPSSGEQLKTSLRPLKHVTLEPAIKIPVVRIPEITIRHPSPVTPKPIEREFMSQEAKEIAKTMIKEAPEFSEEDVFVPPLLEKLSLATKLMGRPVCIVLSKGANDLFIHSIALVCREIYRIVKGGKPEPRWISKGLKDEIEKHLRAEGMIFVVDDSKCEFLPDFSKLRFCKELLEKVNIDVVLDRLHEFFSQEFGFVIFHVNERWANQFAKILEEKVGAYATIIYVSSPNWQQQVKASIAEACWGFVKCEGQTFDEIFGGCEKRFFEELKRAGGDIGLWHYIEEDKNAGEEHESMKAIVVECLAKELGATSKDDVVRMLKEGVIRTEHKLNGEERVDVYLNVPSERFIEIETFYGREDPVRRLDKDTLSKYKRKGINCVDVVLLNGVQALLYAHGLIRLANIYCKEHSLKVNFYLPNIRERKLVSLKDFFHILKNAIGPSKPDIELTANDIERLWSEFSQALRECGVNPEKHRRLFTIMLDRSKSYQDNLSHMLEEIKLLKDEQKET